MALGHIERRIETAPWAKPEIVRLLRLAAGPERPQLAAADNSENTAGFPGR
jgi:hypothetical protein